MTDSYEDFLRSFTLESPDFKRALKILIKYEIHVLLQRLSDTGEESVVITASIADRTNGHLGSQKGRSFLRETEIKSLEEQFLSYCTGQSYDKRAQEPDVLETRPSDYNGNDQNEDIMQYQVEDRKQRDLIGNDRLSTQGTQGQSYDKRAHQPDDVENELSNYDRKDHNEELMQYQVEDRKQRTLIGNDRLSLQGIDDTRTIRESSSESMEQSDDSSFDTTLRRNNSVTMLLSRLDEGKEFVREFYENKDTNGRCNDECCRGSYLDLVGPFIRPAIPSLSASFSVNKDDDSIVDGDTQSYVRESNRYDAVDLSFDKMATRNSAIGQTTFQNCTKAKGVIQPSLSDSASIQNTQNGKNTFNSGNIGLELPNGNQKFLASANGQNMYQRPQTDRNIIAQASFQQPYVQKAFIRKDINSVKKDLVYNDEQSSALVNNNTTESTVLNHLTEGPLMKKPKNIILDTNPVLRSQLSGETRLLEIQGSENSNLEDDSRVKRKLCSRVPCKLRTLLEADGDTLPYFNGERSKVPIKEEVDDIEAQRNTTQGEELKKCQGLLDKKITIKKKPFDEINGTHIKQETMPVSSNEEIQNVETNKSGTGRSLRFVCHYCGENFKNKQFRELHEKLHSTQHPYVCESCGAAFEDEKLYEEHSKIHITHPVLKCENCGYRTSRKFRMNSHREICGKPSKVFTCPYCQKPFLAKRYMKVHMKSHDLSNVHHCPYCVNTYPLKNSLLKHIKTKHRRF